MKVPKNISNPRSAQYSGKEAHSHTRESKKKKKKNRNLTVFKERRKD
jgi:hypothetical protein